MLREGSPHLVSRDQTLDCALHITSNNKNNYFMVRAVASRLLASQLLDSPRPPPENEGAQGGSSEDIHD